MSSDRKDARWEVATRLAEEQNLEYEDFSYEGWNKLLDKADKHLKTFPEDLEGYAKDWRNRR